MAPAAWLQKMSATYPLRNEQNIEMSVGPIKLQKDITPEPRGESSAYWVSFDVAQSYRTMSIWLVSRPLESILWLTKADNSRMRQRPTVAHIPHARWGS